MKTRKIFVLLTQFPGIDSKVLQLWTRFPYSHVSLGLDEDMNTFYSFVVKGFIVEDISRYNKPDRMPFPCELYAYEVTEETYQAVRQTLMSFVNRRQHLSYTKLGLVLSLMQIPWKLENRYICSYFVAQTLQRCTSLKLRKASMLYLPKDFRKFSEMEMVYRGNLLHYTSRFGNRPYPV